MAIRSYPREHIEFRIVCANPDHRMHAYEKPNLQKSLEAVRKNDADQERMPDLPLYRCAPWYVEQRSVGAWERVG